MYVYMYVSAAAVKIVVPQCPPAMAQSRPGIWARHEPEDNSFFECLSRYPILPTQAEVDRVVLDLAGRGDMSLRELRLRLQKLTGID